MGKLISLLGKKLGMLTVTAYAGLDGGKNAQWHCSCECGGAAIVRGSRLRSGETASCGCLRTTPKARAGVVRGDGSVSDEDRALYGTWTAMRARCLSKDHPSYSNYGGRGITICTRWLESFENFAVDVGPRPFVGAELDRRENDGHYSPGNCRWATPKGNSRNRRSVRIIETPHGPMPLWRAVEVSGLGSGTIEARLRRGWTADRLFEPPRPSSRVYSKS